LERLNSLADLGIQAIAIGLSEAERRAKGSREKSFSNLRSIQNCRLDLKQLSFMDLDLCDDWARWQLQHRRPSVNLVTGTICPSGNSSAS
jgi:hypothetical protein